MTHYVAHIKVERVDHEDVTPTGPRIGAAPKQTKRIVTELASVTVKHDSLDSVKDRVGAHIALIDDINEQDERNAQ